MTKINLADAIGLLTGSAKVVSKEFTLCDGMAVGAVITLRNGNGHDVMLNLPLTADVFFDDGLDEEEEYSIDPHPFTMG